MGRIKNTLKQVRFIQSVLNIRNGVKDICLNYISLRGFEKYGYREKSSTVYMPISISNPQNVYLHEYTRIQPGAKIINNKGKFILKKYSACGAGLTVLTEKHIPTTTVPIFFNSLHINDVITDTVVEEDVWIGANTTLMPGITVRRGAVVGSCSVVTKDVPPYAVVAGNPARIIACKFTLTEIIAHEKQLYPVHERLAVDILKNLFDRYYTEKKTIGTSHLTDEDRLKLKNAYDKAEI